LKRDTDNKALYFEAKPDSFGINSSNCRQGRAHLVACGPVFGEVLSPLKSCLLCYLVPDEARQPMGACLVALSEELGFHGLKPGEFSCHGLRIDGTNLMYSLDEAFKGHTGVHENAVSVLSDVTDETDPTPLILVFTDEDCCDELKRDFYRQVVIDQVRSCLLCDLHELSPGASYSTTPDALLLKTTDRIFDFMGRQRQGNLRRLVRERVFKKVFDYWKDKQNGVRLAQDGLTVSWSTADEKEVFLDWLEDRRTRFDATKPPEEELPLFKGLGDGSGDN